jgi:hypothetical protein
MKKNGCDVVDRSSRFSALEGMMAQGVAIVFKSNFSIIPPMEVTPTQKENKEVANVPSISNMRPCDLDNSFMCNM